MIARRPRLLVAPLLVFLAVALSAPVAGCAGEDQPEEVPTDRGAEQERQTEPATTDETGSPETPAPGSRDFADAAGELCSGFFQEAAALQGRLRGLDVSTDSPLSTRRRALTLIERIQARSRRFLADLGAVPLPGEPSARRDASRLVSSTARILLLQRANTGLVRRTVLGRAGPRAQAQVVGLQRQLAAQLADQQELVRRLDISECLSASAGTSG